MCAWDKEKTCLEMLMLGLCTKVSAGTSLVLSPHNTCAGGLRAALILQETFLGKTKSSKKLQEQGPEEPITALGHLCWSHRERGARGDVVSLALPRADWHSTAQQSQDRAGTGVSPGSSQQDPAYLCTAQALPPWQDRGVCLQSPPVPKDSEGAETAMTDRTTAGRVK